MNYSDYPVFFTLATGLVLLLLMHLFRTQAQRFIEQFFRTLQKQFRLLSRLCTHSEQRVRLRHYEVTKALVEILSRRRVERRYGDVEKMVQKELAYYKQKSQAVTEQLSRVEDDYQDSALIPPPSPDWVAAVEAIAQIEGDERNSEVMIKILSDMHGTIQLHQQDAMREHRWNVSNRHKLLAGIEPQWKTLGQQVAAAERKNDLLQYKIRRLDQEMCRYQLLTSGNGQGFMASVSARFAIATLLMTMALMVGFYNSQLLLLPFTQQLGAEALLSLPLLLMHAAMLLMSSLLLFEAVGATHMLPLLASVRPWVKNSLASFAAGMLLVLSVLSACWAGELQTLTAIKEADLNQWSLAIISFFACWLFAAAIIPLEYAIQTLRPVLSNLLQLLLYSLSIIFRVLASFSMEIGRLVMRAYDAVIFIPLTIEKNIKLRQQQRDTINAGPITTVEPTSMTFNKELIDRSNVTHIDFGLASKKLEL